MTANPVELISGMTTTADVPKLDFVAWVKTRVRQRMANAAEVANTDLTGQYAGIYVESINAAFDLNTSDTTSPDDGEEVLIDSAGNRFCIIDNIVQQNFVHIDMYDAPANGTDDDTPALILAETALGSRGGVIYLAPKKYLIDQNHTLPQGVFLVGECRGPGEGVIGTLDTSDSGTVIYINGSATLTVGSMAGVIGAFILRKGLTVPTSPSAADALIAGMTGTAITIAGQDTVLRDLFIGGFNQAIDWDLYTTNHERPRFSNIMFDCRNGIRFGHHGDVGDIEYCRGWPFLTTHAAATLLDGTATQNHIYERDGTAFDCPEYFDWGTMKDCNSFGYRKGFRFKDSNNMVLIDCACDNVVNGNFTDSVGFTFEGTCRGALLLGPRVAAHSVGIKVAGSTGSIRIVGYNCWANGTHLKVDGPNDVYVTGAEFSNLTTSFGGSPVVVTSNAYSGGSARLAFHNNLFRDLGGTYGATVYSVVSSAYTQMSFNGNRYLDCTNNLAELTQTTDSSGNAVWTVPGNLLLKPIAGRVRLERAGDVAIGTRNTSAAANEGGWDFYNSATAFYLRAVTDDLSTAQVGYQGTRGVGATVLNHKFFTAGVLRLGIYDDRVQPTVPVLLPSDPTLALHASTKQYSDLRTVGPASATDGNFALFDGTTGKLLKNGLTPGYFASGTSAANLTGTVASARLSGAYTGVTGLGTQASLLSFGTGFIGTAGDANVLRAYDTGNPATSYGLGISSGQFNFVSGGAVAVYTGGAVRLTIGSGGEVSAAQTIKTGSYTVGTLPTASAVGAGARAYVTDASVTHTAGIGTTVVGGGSNKTPVISNGTNWIIG